MALEEEVRTRSVQLHEEALSGEDWLLAPAPVVALLEVIEGRSLHLGDLVEVIGWGVTGYNDAFILDAETGRQLLEADPRHSEVVKPLVAGGEIGAYRNTWPPKPWSCPVTSDGVGPEVLDGEGGGGSEGGAGLPGE